VSPSVEDTAEEILVQLDEWVKNLLDSLHEGVLIADQDSTVVYINPSYTRITDVSSEQIVGKPLSAIRPGSKLPEVVQTGKMSLGVHRKVGNSEYVVNIVPIMEDGRIAGGISMVTEINEVYALAQKLEKSDRLIRSLKNRVGRMARARYTFENIVWGDARSIESLKTARKIAEKGMNVLITGESGTGKELFAQSIHNASDRRSAPFVAVNCATLDSNLLESELFGYEDGTFTGGRKGGKSGLFEEADGGTLFLDEISEMEPRLQATLLRTLQENAIRPVGGVAEVPVDVRVITATNTQLDALIAAGRFREDLYYRIAASTLNLAPLRERPEDVPALIRSFLASANRDTGTSVTLSDEALRVLGSYDWPGNVRELKNTIQYCVMMTEGTVISAEELPRRIQERGLKSDLIGIRTLSDRTRETEAFEIRRALLKYGGTLEGKRRVAEALGISLASLYHKIKEHGIPGSPGPA
jgi:transcriptional regulator with PAS, ATPase and Fis domain